MYSSFWVWIFWLLICVSISSQSDDAYIREKEKSKTKMDEGNHSASNLPLRTESGVDIENLDLLDGKERENRTTYGEPLLTKRKNTTSQIAIVGSNVCPIESLDYE